MFIVINYHFLKSRVHAFVWVSDQPNLERFPPLLCPHQTSLPEASPVSGILRD